MRTVFLLQVFHIACTLTITLMVPMGILIDGTIPMLTTVLMLANWYLMWTYNDVWHELWNKWRGR